MVSNKLSSKAWVPKPKICKPPPPPPITAAPPIKAYLEATVSDCFEWCSYSSGPIWLEGPTPSFEYGADPPEVGQGYMRLTTDPSGSLVLTLYGKVNTECGDLQISRVYDPPIEKSDPPHTYMEEDYPYDCHHIFAEFEF